MAVTLQHIADDLQLSKATVSRSLRNDPLILPQTRAKVHATAVRLGYEGRPREARNKKEVESTTPRNGASNSRDSLGLLFPATSLEQAQHDGNFVQIMQGVMTEAERVGRFLMMQTIPPSREGVLDENPSAVPALIQEAACQAIIVRGSLPEADVAFMARHLPVVSIGRTYHELLVDAVVPDSMVGVRTLVTHLVGLGHRHLAWVGADFEASFVEERQGGFVIGCLHHGLPLDRQQFMGPEIYIKKGRIGVGDTLVEVVKNGITALVCANDAIARQVITLLENAGLRVPHDVSVTGFDAEQQPDFGRQVTSIDPRFAELGRAAVRLAVGRVTQSASPPCILTVRGELILGETAAAPR